MGAAWRDLGPAASGAGVAAVATEGVSTGTSGSTPGLGDDLAPDGWPPGVIRGRLRQLFFLLPPQAPGGPERLAQEGHQPHVRQAGGPHDTDEQDQSQGQSGPDRIEARKQDGRQETPEVAAAVMRTVAPPQGQQPRRGQQDPQAREGLEPAQVFQALVVGLPGQAQEHQGRPIGGQTQQPDEVMRPPGPRPCRRCCGPPRRPTGP